MPYMGKERATEGAAIFPERQIGRTQFHTHKHFHLYMYDLSAKSDMPPLCNQQEAMLHFIVAS